MLAYRYEKDYRWSYKVRGIVTLAFIPQWKEEYSKYAWRIWTQTVINWSMKQPSKHKVNLLNKSRKLYYPRNPSCFLIFADVSFSFIAAKALHLFLRFVQASWIAYYGLLIWWLCSYCTCCYYSFSGQCKERNTLKLVKVLWLQPSNCAGPSWLNVNPLLTYIRPNYSILPVKIFLCLRLIVPPSLEILKASPTSVKHVAPTNAVNLLFCLDSTQRAVAQPKRRYNPTLNWHFSRPF